MANFGGNQPPPGFMFMDSQMMPVNPMNPSPNRFMYGTSPPPHHMYVVPRQEMAPLARQYGNRKSSPDDRTGKYSTDQPPPPGTYDTPSLRHDYNRDWYEPPYGNKYYQPERESFSRSNYGSRDRHREFYKYDTDRSRDRTPPRDRETETRDRGRDRSDAYRGRDWTPTRDRDRGRDRTPPRDRDRTPYRKRDGSDGYRGRDWTPPRDRDRDGKDDRDRDRGRDRTPTRDRYGKDDRDTYGKDDRDRDRDGKDDRYPDKFSDREFYQENLFGKCDKNRDGMDDGNRSRDRTPPGHRSRDKTPPHHTSRDSRDRTPPHHTSRRSRDRTPPNKFTSSPHSREKGQSGDRSHRGSGQKSSDSKNKESPSRSRHGMADCRRSRSKTPFKDDTSPPLCNRDDQISLREDKSRDSVHGIVEEIKQEDFEKQNSKGNLPASKAKSSAQIKNTRGKRKRKSKANLPASNVKNSVESNGSSSSSDASPDRKPKISGSKGKSFVQRNDRNSGNASPDRKPYITSSKPMNISQGNLPNTSSRGGLRSGDVSATQNTLRRRLLGAKSVNEMKEHCIKSSLLQTGIVLLNEDEMQDVLMFTHEMFKMKAAAGKRWDDVSDAESNASGATLCSSILASSSEENTKGYKSQSQQRKASGTSKMVNEESSSDADTDGYTEEVDPSPNPGKRKSSKRGKMFGPPSKKTKTAGRPREMKDPNLEKMPSGLSPEDQKDWKKRHSYRKWYYNKTHGAKAEEFYKKQSSRVLTTYHSQKSSETIETVTSTNSVTKNTTSNTPRPRGRPKKNQGDTSIESIESGRSTRSTNPDLKTEIPSEGEKDVSTRQPSTEELTSTGKKGRGRKGRKPSTQTTAQKKYEQALKTVQEYESTVGAKRTSDDTQPQTDPVTGDENKDAKPAKPAKPDLPSSSEPAEDLKNDSESKQSPASGDDNEDANRELPSSSEPAEDLKNDIEPKKSPASDDKKTKAALKELKALNKEEADVKSKTKPESNSSRGSDTRERAKAVIRKQLQTLKEESEARDLSEKQDEKVKSTKSPVLNLTEQEETINKKKAQDAVRKRSSDNEAIIQHILKTKNLPPGSLSPMVKINQLQGTSNLPKDGASYSPNQEEISQEVSKIIEGLDSDSDLENSGKDKKKSEAEEKSLEDPEVVEEIVPEDKEKDEKKNETDETSSEDPKDVAEDKEKEKKKNKETDQKSIENPKGGGGEPIVTEENEESPVEEKKETKEKSENINGRKEEPMDDRNSSNVEDEMTVDTEVKPTEMMDVDESEEYREDEAMEENNNDANVDLDGLRDEIEQIHDTKPDLVNPETVQKFTTVEVEQDPTGEGKQDLNEKADLVNPVEVKQNPTGEGSGVEVEQDPTGEGKQDLNEKADLVNPVEVKQNPTGEGKPEFKPELNLQGDLVNPEMTVEQNPALKTKQELNAEMEGQCKEKSEKINVEKEGEGEGSKTKTEEITSEGEGSKTKTEEIKSEEEGEGSETKTEEIKSEEEGEGSETKAEEIKSEEEEEGEGSESDNESNTSGSTVGVPFGETDEEIRKEVYKETKRERQMEKEKLLGHFQIQELKDGENKRNDEEESDASEKAPEKKTSPDKPFKLRVMLKGNVNRPMEVARFPGIEERIDIDEQPQFEPGYNPVLDMSPVSFNDENSTNILSALTENVPSALDDQRLRRRTDGELVSDDFYECFDPCQDNNPDKSLDWMDEISSSQGSTVSQAGVSEEKGEDVRLLLKMGDFVKVTWQQQVLPALVQGFDKDNEDEVWITYFEVDDKRNKLYHKGNRKYITARNCVLGKIRGPEYHSSKRRRKILYFSDM